MANNGDDERRRASTAPRRTSGPTRRSTKGNWTPEEDAILAEAVKKYNGKNWKKIAELLEERTDVQCLHRWQKVLNPALIKGAWTKEEDDLLINLVKKNGCENWSVIANSLPGRIGKQCRERWYNQLNPANKKDPWTMEEEVNLVIAHRTFGNKWAEIAKFLAGSCNSQNVASRTPYMISPKVCLIGSCTSHPPFVFIWVDHRACHQLLHLKPGCNEKSKTCTGHLAGSDNSIKNHWNCSLKRRCQDVIDPKITCLDFNNYEPKAKLLKTELGKRSNRLLEQEKDPDGCSLVLERSSVKQNASMGSQDLSLAYSIKNCDNFITSRLFPEFWMLNQRTELSNITAVESNSHGTDATETFSIPEDYSQQTFTSPDLSLSLGRTPSSPKSTSTRAGESFETQPSLLVIKRENQSDGVLRCSEIAKSKFDIWRAEQFSHLSPDYLRLGLFGSTESIIKRLEPVLDTELGGSSGQ